ncbi:hypothetical protein [Nocardia terpenica]|uniref:Uncharacterized protein n=1 Tax=Nocardia terpenica TaxID=455432 RepID=A0A6G9Z7V5_9NOCA|nr:hypothetical protein [Nocardia terpenica]QIS21679.1 hypothetical protein F6W96_28405 [Nocardia terpenica]
MMGLLDYFLTLGGLCISQRNVVVSTVGLLAAQQLRGYDSIHGTSARSSLALRPRDRRYRFHLRTQDVMDIDVGYLLYLS